ncbi:unnamed protein product [Paramecium sonneborni]|uniref:Uncharacterized protein n=1 Tax=Paramecium sonneborni TaxID=65129 RepID=A0A8S1PHB2_9CILI|nr:unnamed protein product [Paramecium sonneborni]
MWLRLSYLSFRSCFNKKMVNGRFFGPDISGRYKGLLRKQFYFHGLPWIYDQPKNRELSPYHRKPKGHKRERTREQRIEKIKKNLMNYAEEEFKFRQERLNKRPSRGLDMIVQKMIPSWIHPKTAAQLQSTKQLLLMKRGRQPKQEEEYKTDQHDF